jgi:hypothetical protein
MGYLIGKRSKFFFFSHLKLPAEGRTPAFPLRPGASLKPPHPFLSSHRMWDTGLSDKAGCMIGLGASAGGQGAGPSDRAGRSPRSYL